MRPATHLDGVHIRGNHHKARLLVLHQVRDVVQAELDVTRALGVLSSASRRLGLRSTSQARLLLRGRLRSVLVQQLEHGHSCDMHRKHRHTSA
jgi:hypothetical protein